MGKNSTEKFCRCIVLNSIGEFCYFFPQERNVFCTDYSGAFNSIMLYYWAIISLQFSSGKLPSEILSNLKNDYICMLNVKEGHFSFDLNVTKGYGTRIAKKSLHFGGLICFPRVIDFCQVALSCSVTKS